MRFTTTLVASALLAVSSLSANAGGLSTPVATTPVVEVMAPAPAGSLNSNYVILGLLAVLVAIAASSTGSDSSGPDISE